MPQHTNFRQDEIIKKAYKSSDEYAIDLIEIIEELDKEICKWQEVSGFSSYAEMSVAMEK